MAESKERRKTARKPTQATPGPDTRTVQTSSEDTRRRIAEVAYFRAKERNFEPGHELEDWIEAESEVMGRSNGAER